MKDTVNCGKDYIKSKKLLYDIENFKPDVCITKWVDYTHKYGLAYQLSNGNMAVNFNDGTIVILDKDCHHIEYLEKDTENEEEYKKTCYTITRYPRALK